MSFDYDRIKAKEEGGSHWATYSDLFMVLSLVFLLLYVIASLRTGTGFQEVIRDKKDLEQQLVFYQNQKENYLAEAKKEEQKRYEELMKKMELMQEEAKDKSSELQAAAQAQNQKAKDLNQYQKMIKNIIDANILSSVNIKRRDNTIDRNFEEIDAQREEIQDLEQTVVKKQAEIQKGESQIKNLNKTLNSKMDQIKKLYKQKKITKTKMQAQIKELKEENQVKVVKLQLANAKAKKEIRKNQQIIQEAQAKLASAEETIASQEQDIQKLVQEQQQTTQKISEMRNNFNSQMEQERQDFEKKMAQQKLSARAKAAKQAEFMKQAQAKEAEMASKIQGMESKVQQVQGQLDKTRQEKESLAAKSESLAQKANDLAGQKAKLSKDLQKMKELANAKKKVIDQMKKNLAKVGLKADVDARTGDVVIQFGDEYFDTGKAQIKPGMEKVLQRFMPEYTKTLFSDPKTAEKIKSIEVIGFASPTYKGKFVNPVSLKAEDKKAMNYNLDLSYYRARSIFDYIFDKNKMSYQYQKKILPMVKVTGKSFLAEGTDGRDVSSMTQKEYCQKYDCKKSQRVVIKFNMEN